MHDDDTAVLASVPTEWEATLITDALNERGINAQSSGGMTSGFRAEAPGMARVIVTAADLPAAQKALAEIREEASNIDWSKVDLGEPEG